MRKLASALGVLALSAFAPTAHAALEISYRVNGGAIVTCDSEPVSSGPASCPFVAAAPVTITVIGAISNSPGTAVIAQEFGTTLEIASTAAATLEIWLISQDFTSPAAPPDVDFRSNYGFSTTAGTGTVDMASCADPTNSLATGAAFCTGAGATLLENLASPYDGASIPLSSGNNSVGTLVATLGTPYAMGQYISVTLGAGSNLNVLSSSSIRPTPEPMSIALLGGVALLSVRAIRRKRQAKA